MGNVVNKNLKHKPAEIWKEVKLKKKKKTIIEIQTKLKTEQGKQDILKNIKKNRKERTMTGRMKEKKKKVSQTLSKEINDEFKRI